MHRRTLALIPFLCAALSAQTSNYYYQTPATLPVTVVGSDPGNCAGVKLQGTANGQTLFACAALTQTPVSIGPLAVTNAPPAVIVPSAVVPLTANKPANWTLAPGSTGTLTVADPLHATFTAPASLPGKSMTTAGCLASALDSVFNTPVDTLPVHPNDAAYHNGITTIPFTFEPSWGIQLVSPSTPVYPMSFYYTPANNGSYPIPDPPNYRQGGSYDARDGDHHTVALRTSDCTWWETYNYSPDHSLYACRNGQIGCNGQSGVTYTPWDYKVQVSGATDAANLPIMPLTLTARDIREGVGHALRFVLPLGQVGKGDGKTNWPSLSTNGSIATGPPYGTRFRLKASFATPATLSPGAQNIVNGLRKYGMFLADATSGQFAASTTQDVNTDPVAYSAMIEVQNLRLAAANFEAVDQSSLMVSANSTAVTTPAAAVIAADISNPASTVITRIPIQPIGVGIANEHVAFAAGAPAIPLSSWVTGTANQSVSCKLLSGPGTLNGCSYTAPATVAATTEGSIQITSAADPGSSVTQYFSVLPVAANQAIRINAGMRTDSKDATGGIWSADNPAAGLLVQKPSDYPNWSGLTAAQVPFRTQFQSYNYTYAEDIRYDVYTTNGPKLVHLLSGMPTCGNGCVPDPAWHSNIDILASNGTGLQTVQHKWDYGAAQNWKPQTTGQDLYFPMFVTNNVASLVFMVNNAQHGTTQNRVSPTVNAFEIIPAPATPKLTIDADAQAKTVGLGKTLQLYAVAWYTSGAVTWSVSAGTISSSGLFTAPATAESVTITASLGTLTASYAVQAQ